MSNINEAIAEITSASHDNAEHGERGIRILRDFQHLEYGTKLYAHPAKCLHQIQEPEADIWPCVNIDVDASGKITNAKLYSPGLPAGNHDVYPVRVPYMDEHTEAWRACVDELEKAVPGFMSLGNMNGIECAVAAIRGLAERAKHQDPSAAEQAAWHADLDEGRAQAVQAAAPEYETCETCQGNGEIVTDWARYKYPYFCDKGDEAVSPCQDCQGTGEIAPAHPAEGVQAVEQGEVLVTVSGFTGSGKSAIAGEIEIMCRALGLQVEWPDGDPEKNLTHADWTEALELYKPRVRIVECNVPHPFVKGQDK